MATQVYDTIELELEDDSTVIIKPLPIKHLRKFMTIIAKTSSEEVETEEDLMDVFVEACVFCLKSLHPKAFADKTSDDIEGMITLPTIMKILEVAGGLKTSDPNLLGAALVGMN